MKTKFLIVISVIVFNIGLNASSQFFDKILDLEINQSINPYKVLLNEGTHLTCLFTCLKEIDCIAISFHELPFKCSLYSLQSQTISNYFVSKQKSIVFVKKVKSCPSTWTRESGYCYFVSGSTNYASAKAYCINQGGTLVNLYTTNDYNFYKLKISQKFFIGLENINSLWKWTNGAEVNNSMWSPTTPPATGPCGALDVDGIVPDVCSHSHISVCEKR